MVKISDLITQFSQPDSIIPDLYNPQALNRYAYANNNPLYYIDPSGHWVVESNNVFAEERRDAYLGAWKRTSKDKHAGHLKEYYLVAAAYYQSLVDEAPAESTEFLAIKLKSQADNVRRNGWNNLADAQSAAGDISLSNAPDMLGPATIGMAGLFGKSGIPTSTEFDKRLGEWGYSEEKALTVYQSGDKYTDNKGQWIRWDPKSKIAVVVDQFDGTAVTIYNQPQKPRGWTPGWIDITLGPEP